MKLSSHELASATILVLGTVIACSDESETAPPSGGGGSGGSSTGHLTCPDISGTWGMVLVPRSDGLSFCIDGREVTNEQYAAFLASDASPQLHPACQSTDHTPKADWPQPSERSRYPVTSVSWCDAFAFCAANGKRLCGDATGGVKALTASLDEETAAGNAESEMWLACTKGGTQTYAYGNELEAGRCNDVMFADDYVAADTDTTCEGGYPGIYFLQGNAREWEGLCKFDPDPGLPTSVYCVSRCRPGCAGAAVPANQSPVETAALEVSFRCCADAVDAAR